MWERGRQFFLPAQNGGMEIVMDSLRHFAAMVAITSCIIGIAGIVAPEGKLERVYKLVLSIFFLIVAISSIGSVSKKIDFDALHRVLRENAGGSKSPLSSGALEKAAVLAEEQIKKNIVLYAEEMNITPVSVQVDITVNEDKFEIVKTVVEIREENMGKSLELTKVISDYLGVSAEVIMAGETG